jgi:hypothetical protein
MSCWPPRKAYYCLLRRAEELVEMREKRDR